MKRAVREILFQASRMLMRDWRGGELQLLVAALVVAVAAVTSVGFFVERLRAGFERDVAQLLGGDLIVSADQPIAEAYRVEAQARGLRTAQLVQFPSMAMQADSTSAVASDPRAQLVGLKAVGPGYPLRGGVRIAPDRGAADHVAPDIPAPGTVWVDDQLLAALDVSSGGTLQLGERRFQVTGLITLEADRGAGFINFAPRVMMRIDDLPATGLLQPGARATYRLLIAGDAKAVADYRRWLKPQLARGQRIEALTSDGESSERPQSRQTIERAQSFLSLVALMTVMLAAVAVALATRRFVQRHIDTCAILRCLGSTSGQITAVFAVEFVAVGMLASLIGAGIGYGAHFALLEGIGNLVGADLPSASALPAWRGIVTGMVLLIGFALPPLLQLRQVPPLRVLRRDLGPPAVSMLVTYGLGLGAFGALLLWFADDAAIAMVTGLGFLSAFGVFAGVVYIVLRAIGWWRERLRRPSIVLRFALAGAVRRPASTVLQVVALAIGLMALLLLTMTRNDLVEGWRNAAPADAPNRFVINIQPDQRTAFNDALERYGLPRQELLPMVRGRLVAVNDRAVSVDDYTGRARRLVDREFNLSYMDRAPEHNEIVAGQWFAPDAQALSIEQGLMKDLGLQLGDRLRFDVAGTAVEARVGSVRKLEWTSFRVNFFVIFPTRMLEPLQQSFITSFHMPADREATGKLLAQFPNLTIVDTGAILAQVQRAIEQAIAAVEFLFGFALVAGVLVLYAALAATRDERIREAALLRALGATQAQLARARWIEFSFMGGLAGVLAAAGASATGAALAVYAFDFTLHPNPLVFVVGIAAGAALSLIGAWLGLRGVVRQPPLQTLRDA